MSTPPNEAKAHFNPSLQGLRGVAVLIVTLSHIIKDRDELAYALGRAGTTIFFVLSGYLVTGVLIRKESQSLESNRKFDLFSAFIKGRLVRLYPALLAMVMSMTALHYWFNGYSLPEGYTSNVILALTFTSNIEKWHFKPFIWINTWTLSVEEPFYWALASWALLISPQLGRSLKSRSSRMGLSCIALASFIACVQGNMNEEAERWFNYYYAICHIWKLCAGCMLQLAPATPKLLPGTSWLGLAMLAVSIYLSSQSTAKTGSPSNFTVTTEPLAAISALLIIAGTTDHHSNRLLCQPWVKFLGRISYALYLYQVPLMFLGTPDWNRGWQAVLNTALAGVCAGISTVALEEPVGRWFRGGKGGDAVDRYRGKLPLYELQAVNLN